MTYLTTAEVAKQLRCSERHITRQAERGTIGHLRIGSEYRFTPEDVDAFVAANRVEVAPRRIRHSA